MSWFPRPVGPRAAIADLLAVIRHSSREQRLGGTLAFLVTVIIVIIFFVDSKINTAPPPQVIYVEQWPENRTDAEIEAQQVKDEAKRQAELKEQQRQYQELEKKLGM